MDKINHFIINAPYEEPKEHWQYNALTESFDRVAGRRKSEFIIATPGVDPNKDQGVRIEIKLVNKIRPRVKKWRENNYPGVTGVTRKLLEHWYNTEIRENKRFFFCQLEAIETLIWFTESHETERSGIEVPGDGGAFKRLCTKLCTGGGKTAVMAMLIAWQVCNKAAYPQDKRFSKNVFIVTPGLTVKSRLQVLQTGGTGNYYHQFDVVPLALTDKLDQGKIVITNWQALAWDNAETVAKKKSVDKRGPKSDTAYTLEILRSLGKAQNILVINDEAHHAWRINAENKGERRSREEKEAEKEATIWIGGLDRIHKVRKILTCYDFSATPFIPSGKKNEAENIFEWIISDFNLNDGVESGLVKTPRIVIRDNAAPDARTFRSKLFHIYTNDEVKNNIKKAEKPEVPLPDLIIQAYNLLGDDWLKTFKKWREIDPITNRPLSETPPVMITVANRTETAARIEHAFKNGHINIKELCEPEYLIHIDSASLENPDENPARENTLAGHSCNSGNSWTKREKADTVGQVGKAGEQIRNVISVGMLSEGWDTRTVTHILGLRAFSSQLLCEQVVGRGLRRRSYEINEETGLFDPEYVNIFGIPFSLLPLSVLTYETGEERSASENGKKLVQVLTERAEYEITWPNIARIDREINPCLSVDFSQVEPLTLDMADSRHSAELAPVLEKKPDIGKCSIIDLEEIESRFRLQEIIFKTAAILYATLKADWKEKGTDYALIGQVFYWVEKYIESGKIRIEPALFEADKKSPRVRVLLMSKMNRIVEHLWQFIRLQETEVIRPSLNLNRKISSTKDMRAWFTSKPCSLTRKSHINYCVYDSTWEASEAYALDRNSHVSAWAKNDHLGFYVYYRFEGRRHTYYPDFFVKLDNGKTLILETKGRDSPETRAKQLALAEWVEAANALKEYGVWAEAISFNTADVDAIIESILRA